MKLEKFETYLNTINTLDDKSYIMMLIAYNASPTIARFKPSSLMVFRNDTDRDLYFIWEKYKDEIIRGLNIECYELKRTEKSVHVLFYDYIKLNNVLRDSDNLAFLNYFGYTEKMNIFEMLNLLRQRYENVCPHEIGVFLGYPISDVVDFIECPNKECLLRGYWKVYNDLEKAKKTFRSYDMIKVKVIDYMVKNA